MEIAKKPAVFFQTSFQVHYNHLVTQNGAFERQFAATLTFARSYFPNTELKPLNHLKLVLAFLVTSTCPTNVACPAWKLPKKPTIFFQTIWSRQFLQLQDPVSPTQDSKVIEIY